MGVQVSQEDQRLGVAAAGWRKACVYGGALRRHRDHVGFQAYPLKKLR